MTNHALVPIRLFVWLLVRYCGPVHFSMTGTLVPFKYEQTNYDSANLFTLYFRMIWLLLQSIAYNLYGLIFPIIESRLYAQTSSYFSSILNKMIHFSGAVHAIYIRFPFI